MLMPKKFSLSFWNLVTLIFWISISIGLFYLMNYPRLPALINQLGILGPAAIVLLFAITAPTPVTAEILLLSSGVLFGPVIGSLTNIVGIFTSSMVEYFFAEKLFDAKLFTRAQKKLPFGLGKLPVRSPAFLIVGKLLPSVGAKIVNLAAGVYRVPLHRQIWTSLVTTIPGALFWGIGGNELMRIAKNIFA